VLTFKYGIGPDTRLTFNDKPDAAIRALLKGAGFRWEPSGGFWWRRGVRGAADFIAALEKRIGPRRPDAPCWICKAPDGYLRNRGAAAPVWCDGCAAMADYWEQLPAPEQKRFRALSQGTELTAAQLAYTNRPHPADSQADRFDRDFEDRCREACGL
jgi:hypothetical protein